MTSREVERVQKDYERLKATGCCRQDIPSDVFASVLVGEVPGTGVMGFGGGGLVRPG